MLISVINQSSLKDRDVQRAIRAINRQIHEDFDPYWSMKATLRLEGKTLGRPIDPQNPVDMRGDGIIYLKDEYDRRYLGSHHLNYRGVPYGFVFRDIADELKEDWTIGLSHEALEMLADPEVNLLVKGPHPDPVEKGRTVFHWYEMCDAVQDEHYFIDDIAVSNFLLPLYFTRQNGEGQRNDFLCERYEGKTLRAFGASKNGYVGFYDPLLGRHTIYSPSQKAKQRKGIKHKASMTRRSLRYMEGNLDLPLLQDNENIA